MFVQKKQGRIFDEKFITRWNALKCCKRVLTHRQAFQIADAKLEGKPATVFEVVMMKELGWDLQQIRDTIKDALIMGLIKKTR